jgi:hypothetical protein
MHPSCGIKAPIHWSAADPGAHRVTLPRSRHLVATLKVVVVVVWHADLHEAVNLYDNQVLMHFSTVW